MSTNVTREQGRRWVAQAMMLALVLVAAYAVTQYMTIGQLESAVSQAQAESQKASQDWATMRKKMQDDLKTANAKVAELEAKQRESDAIRTLVVNIEPQVAPILEAAGKTGKPDVRATALAGLGLIGQIAHDVNHEAALGALDRALALNKGNCVAGLAVNLSSTKKVDVAADCQALLPAPASNAKPAPVANPASDAKPAADTKPATAPAGDAGKAAQPAAKS